MAPSPIECLPVELLQPIFIDSDYNVALLQASSRIGARLSSDYVYNATCAHYLDGVLEDRRAQSAAQTYIFASKWMTWAFLQSWVIRIYERNGCLCGLTADTGCFDAQWPPNFENATEMVFSRSHLPRIAFIRGRLPKKLLNGPWTPDKIQFLQFLLWITSMTVDWSDSEARQIAIEGRQQAIRESNLDAVALFNHNRRLGKVATLPLVRYAVIEGGCNRSIVYDTMSIASMGDSRLAWDCDELDKWCEDRIAAGDPKGAWLKMKLEELRAPSRPGKGWQDDGIGYKRLFGGELNSDAGNYDGGVDDQLVVKNHKWNQPIRQFGWWYEQNEYYPQKKGLHGVTRGDLGDFWTYAHGTHRATRGVDYTWIGNVQQGGFWYDGWIPTSKCQGVGECTCPTAEDEEDEED